MPNYGHIDSYRNEIFSTHREIHGSYGNLKIWLAMTKKVMELSLKKLKHYKGIGK